MGISERTQDGSYINIVTGLPGSFCWLTGGQVSEEEESMPTSRTDNFKSSLDVLSYEDFRELLETQHRLAAQK